MFNVFVWCVCVFVCVCVHMFIEEVTGAEVCLMCLFGVFVCLCVLCVCVYAYVY